MAMQCLVKIANQLSIYNYNTRGYANFLIKENIEESTEKNIVYIELLNLPDAMTRVK